jgi:ATP-binding cassette subfamily C (CFTR/MRP) protein 4
MFLHYLWVGPIQVAVVVALLWGEIGPSCLVGIALLIFLMPLQTQFGRMFSVYR